MSLTKERIIDTMFNGTDFSRKRSSQYNAFKEIHNRLKDEYQINFD